MPCGYFTAAPNTAMIVSGLCHANTIIIGGKAWLWPGCQTVQKISLNVITCSVVTSRVYTKEGVPVSITATAQVKVSNKLKNLQTATQLFLGMPTLNPPQYRNRPKNWDSMAEDERIKYLTELDQHMSEHPSIQSCCTQTLEGHQRAIMASMTVEQIYQDRLKFASAVRATATEDFERMGISIISYTLRDVSDDVGYLKAIGQKRTSEILCSARVGEEEQKKLASIVEYDCERVTAQEVYVKKEKESLAERDFRVENAEYNIEVQTKKAVENLATPLQNAKTHQKIVESRLEIDVVERKKDIEIAEQEKQRIDLTLQATVEKVATAEKAQKEELAKGESYQIQERAAGEADGVRLKGEAEASAITAKGEAEAEAMNKKALAYQGYKGAAMVDVVLSHLPQIAAEVATPLSQVEKLTMVAGENGEVGAARLTGEVLDIMSSIPSTVQQLTGVSITDAIARASK